MHSIEQYKQMLRQLWCRNHIVYHRIIAILTAGLLVFFFCLLRINWVNPFPPCGWKTLTGGMDCPGCGLTRALEAVLRMDMLQAFVLHPWAIGWGFILALWFIQYFINAVSGKQWVTILRGFSLYLWAALWSLVGFTFLRNIPFFIELLGG